jgi:hypothetical protein
MSMTMAEQLEHDEDRRMFLCPVCKAEQVMLVAPKCEPEKRTGYAAR